MVRKYNMDEAKNRFWGKSFTDNNRKVISISVDIRKSTDMKSIVGNEGAVEIIKPFIEECYILMQKRGCFDSYIYAGDGLIGVCIFNEPQQASQVFQCAIDLNSYIHNYTTWVKKYCHKYDFNAGIGISYDPETYIEKIKTLETKYNNTVYIGNSISKSVKICNDLPKVVEGRRCNIGVSKTFKNLLPKEDQKYFKWKTSNRFYTDVTWED